MGLDMYAYSCPAKYRKGPLELDFEGAHKDNAPITEFFYWRKNRHLHNWMEQLYIEKGGTEQFNCNVVELTLSDLEQLEKDIISGAVKDLSESGFFFGDNDYQLEYLATDLDFVEEARQKINSGEYVFYSSWW